MTDDLERRIADLEARLATVEMNAEAERVRYQNEVGNRFATLNTPRWKRLVFRIDGWGPWHTVREEPRWRPWRKWWTS